MEIKKVIIQGGGGHARVVTDCLMAQGKTVVAVVDPKDSQLEVPRFESYDPAFEPSAVTLIAIGDNRVRKKIVSSLQHAFTNAIHPSSIISPFATIGNGCMILHRSIVQSGARIGDHVILNTASQVDHDCIIHDYAHIAPGAILCGGVTVGEGALIGAGAVITPGKKIGAWATVGAGAVVIDDIPDNVVVVGNPARIIKQKQS